MDILAAVTERYETLSPAQKRIADYIFKYPDEVCFYSLKEMSEALGVTEVTILRFAKRIGLSSFVELKRQLREHLQVRLSGGDTLGRITDWIGKQADETEDREKLFHEFVENEINVLKKRIRPFP